MFDFHLDESRGGLLVKYDPRLNPAFEGHFGPERLHVRNDRDGKTDEEEHGV
jgi:hypothetical protein